jgi:lipopolysaccharide transport system ATP-binding protein
LISLSVEHLSKCYRRAKKGTVVGARGGLLARLGLRRPQPYIKEVWALQDVSFAVEPGTILGVIGHNGAGKTTLLKTIARLTAPTEGRIRGQGRVMPLLAIGTGFDGNLSARENIFINAAMYGISRSDVLERFDQIVEFAELGESMDVPLRHYSSGMYLRLAFSVAVNMEPDILLADEVLAVGDISFQERCLQRVQEAGTSGMTVLFVSHDMAAITRLCHRVIWLQQGRLVAEGEPGDIVARYQDLSWANTQERGRGSTHGSEVGEIVGVRLLSLEGAEIGAARLSESVLVEIAFRVHRGGIHFRSGFDLNTRGIHVFRSVQREEHLAVEPGVYLARARIPEHFLTETVYSVDARVSLLQGGADTPLRLYNALSFQVYDTGDEGSARGSYGGRMPGVVTPKLDWTVALQESAVAR